MKKELLYASNGEVLSLDADGNTKSLSDATGEVAISLYENFVEYKQCGNESKRKEWRRDLKLHSEILMAMADALAVVPH